MSVYIDADGHNFQPVCDIHKWRGAPSATVQLAAENGTIHTTDFHQPEPALFDLTETHA